MRVVRDAGTVADDAVDQRRTGADRHIIPHRRGRHGGRGDLHVAAPHQVIALDFRELKRGPQVVRRCADVLKSGIRDERRKRSGLVREHVAIEAVDGLGRDAVRQRCECVGVRTLDADEMIILARGARTGEPGDVPVGIDGDAAVFVGSRVRDERHRHPRPAREVPPRIDARSTLVSVSPLTI